MVVRLYESMTRVEVEGFVVRVWRSEKVFTLGPSEGVLSALKTVTTPEEIILVLDKLTGIEAYEILDHWGNGGLVYPDW